LSLFKPPASYYIDEVVKWLHSNPGRCVTQFQAAAMFSRACCRLASIDNAVSIFAGAGMWPLDRSVFHDHDFCAIIAL
jgi:hypothetical protein